MIKRYTALFLAVLLVFSLISTGVCADEEKDSYKIVNVGDSTGVGYGLDDYGPYARYPYIAYRNPGESAVYVRDYLVLYHGFLDAISDDAYPVRLADYIAEKMPDTKVSFTNLGISGIRGAEIRAALDPSYVGENYTQSYWNKLWPMLCASYDLEQWDNDYHRMFTEEIGSADLITLDCLMNSFTDSLSERLNDALIGNLLDSRDYNGRLAELLTEISPSLKAFADTIPDMLKEALKFIIPKSRLQNTVDALQYSVMECIVNFNAIIELIREINPHADILVGGSYCPLEGLTLCYGDYKIDAYALLSPLTDALDNYLEKRCENRNEYTYFKLPDNIETFRTYMADEDSIWDITPSLLTRLVDYSVGLWKNNIGQILYDRSVAVQRNLGVEITPWSTFWVSVVDAAFNDVRENGDSASPQNIALSLEFGRFAEIIFQGMSISELDMETYFNALGSPIYCDTLILSYMDTDIETLSLTERTELFAVLTRDVCGGIAAHFSYKGCEQKYEAALEAYESLTSDEGADGGNVLSRFGSRLTDFFRSLFDLSLIRDWLDSIRKLLLPV